MIDKTTAGITAEPEEVEAVLHNLCGYHLAERDPVFRYTVLTREQVLYDALVAAIKRERGRALSELVASGTTLTHAAQMTNLSSRQQVQRLIKIAKAAEAAAAEVQAASRDFEDRLDEDLCARVRDRVARDFVTRDFGARDLVELVLVEDFFEPDLLVFASPFSRRILFTVRAATSSARPP